MPNQTKTEDLAREVSDVAVADELARQLLRNAPLVLVPSVLIAALVAGVLYPHVPGEMLGAWAAAMATTILARFLLVVAYWRSNPVAGSSVRWARMYTAATFVAGVVWGLLSVLFLAVQPPAVFHGITMTLVGIAAGTMGLYTSWPPAYIAFTTPVLLLLSVTIMVQEDGVILIGMMGLVAYVVFLGLALLAHSRLRAGVRAQLWNRELAERLDAERERAQEGSRAKSELLAGISHDLRQPLQSVHLYTDMLRQQSVSQTADHVTDKINHSLWSMTCMVNQLLDMSRMEVGAVQVDMQAVELEPVAERIYAQFMLRAAHKNIDLEVDCPPLFAWTDPALLTRVLDNLVSNALRYTEVGDVCVLFSGVGDMIEIDVIDSGPGIPPEEQERIFDLYYQIDDNSRQPSEGVGLGLAIVRRLCVLMDIKIEILSTEGGGTRVKLRLPAATADSGDMAPAVQAGEIADQALRNRHVMVVEKDAAVRAAIEEALASRGCIVAGFSATEPAQAALDTAELPEIIIVDVGLKGDRDGIEWIRDLRQETGHAVPVLLIASNTEEIDLPDEAGLACEVLQKPVDTRSLVAGMVRAIGQAHSA